MMDNNDIDDDDDQKMSNAGRTCTVFVIDSIESMFDANHSNQCPLLLSVRAILNRVRRSCLSASQHDLYAVAFFNTANTQFPDSNHCDHIYLWQTLSPACVELVKSIRCLNTSNDQILHRFNKLFGGYSDECDYGEALRCVYRYVERDSLNQQIRITRDQLRIVLFTTNSQPHFGDNDRLHRLRKACETLGNAELKIAYYGRDMFDPKVWINVISNMTQKRIGDRFVADALDDKEFAKVDYRKEYKKRVFRRLNVQLADGLQFSVGLYNIMAPNKVPSALHLKADDNTLLRTVTNYKNAKTGAVLLSADKQSVTQIGGEMIKMDAVMKHDVRQLCESGIQLLGFKSIDCIKPQYLIKSAQFIYPDEDHIDGSIRLYRALLIKCLERRMVVICRMCTSGIPRLVALYPQRGLHIEATRREPGEYIVEGFYVIFLPYADDLRDLSPIMQSDETKWPKANADQVEKARGVIDKLTFKYVPDLYKNPVTQQHYQVFEAIALDKTKKDKSEKKKAEEASHTPSDSNIQIYMTKMTEKYSNVLDQFKSALFSDDYVMGVSGSKKRAKISTDVVAAKKIKTDLNDVDLKSESTNGKLERYTVADLRQLANNADIRLTGATKKKADIISAICDHYKNQ